MRALFIGRFQPFHIGHLSSILKTRYDGCDELVIGIGSSQESGTDKNPFTATERKEMLDYVLKEHRELNYRIIFIPDINNYPRWVAHTERILEEAGIGKIGIVYTNNQIVKELFEKANYRIVEPELVRWDSEPVMATRVREMIASDDESWKKLVPKETIEMLEKFDGVKRIKRIYSKLKR